jgi:hypothetical protein
VSHVDLVLGVEDEKHAPNREVKYRELVARMGHASTRAALVYLHDTDDRSARSPPSSVILLGRAGAPERTIREDSGDSGEGTPGNATGT